MNAPLRLVPILADRPVIARPAHPFTLPPGAAVTAFISTTLWVDLSLQESAVSLQKSALKPDKSVVTLPLFRPSDTWFGRSTIQGELCYAMRTALRMNLADMPRRPHRAITAVHINNRGPDPLRVHRIRLPVQHLTLFSDDTGELWTQALQMSRADAGEATIELRSSPPAIAGNTRLVSPPRTPSEPSKLLKAITSFLP